MYAFKEEMTVFSFNLCLLLIYVVYWMFLKSTVKIYILMSHLFLIVTFLLNAGLVLGYKKIHIDIRKCG